MMKSELEIAKEIMQGKWGIGKERETKIRKAGYDYSKVQALVNEMIRTGKTIKEITVDGKDCCGFIIKVEV